MSAYQMNLQRMEINHDKEFVPYRKRNEIECELDSVMYSQCVCDIQTSDPSARPTQDRNKDTI